MVQFFVLYSILLSDLVYEYYRAPFIGSKGPSENQSISEKSGTFAIDKWDPIVFVDQIWEQNPIKHKKLDHLAFGIVRKDQITAEIEQNQDPKKS